MYVENVYTSNPTFINFRHLFLVSCYLLLCKTHHNDVYILYPTFMPFHHLFHSVLLYLFYVKLTAILHRSSITFFFIVCYLVIFGDKCNFSFFYFLIIVVRIFKFLVESLNYLVKF